MKTLTFNRQTLVACTLVLCAAPLWAQSTAPAETTAQCQARITAEYDAKIAKAQAEGEAGAKKVALFTRKKAEYVESCKNKDEIAASEQRIAANKQEIAAMNQVLDIAKKVEAGQKMSPSDLQTLSQVRASMAQLGRSESVLATLGTIDLLEIRTGQKVPAAPLDSSKGAAR